MKSAIVTQHNEFWRGHPDVAIFNKKFYVVFRESVSHQVNDNTRIRIVTSLSGDRYSPPDTIAESENGRYNCPRLSVSNDKLWIVCDFVKNNGDFINAENEKDNTSIHMFYTEDGEKWHGPIETNITGIVPDRIFKTNDNHYLIATHIFYPREQRSLAVTKGSLGQNVWRTNNLEDPNSWAERPVIAHKQFNLCEGSICRIKDKMIVCMMRENSQVGLPAFVSYSWDEGKTWFGLNETRIWGCHRPVLGELQSGNFLVTYREQTSAFRDFFAKNTFAQLLDPKTLVAPFCNSAKDKLHRGIILPLDHDKSPRSDGGYTGWLQLPNGKIYIVNYITYPHRLAYIKWYLIDETMF
jgi:sialidase-1|tara:strand:- start:9107 stop:10165 length:1059 start_codon:yes stop_codon:yes gene_type:complete